MKGTFYSPLTIDELNNRVTKKLSETTFLGFFRYDGALNKGLKTFETYKINRFSLFYIPLPPSVYGKYEEWGEGTKVEIKVKIGFWFYLQILFYIALMVGVGAFILSSDHQQAIQNDWKNIFPLLMENYRVLLALVAWVFFQYMFAIYLPRYFAFQKTKRDYQLQSEFPELF